MYIRTGDKFFSELKYWLNPVQKTANHCKEWHSKHEKCFFFQVYWWNRLCTIRHTFQKLIWIFWNSVCLGRIECIWVDPQINPNPYVLSRHLSAVHIDRETYEWVQRPNPLDTSLPLSSAPRSIITKRPSSKLRQQQTCRVTLDTSCMTCAPIAICVFLSSALSTPYSWANMLVNHHQGAV